MSNTFEKRTKPSPEFDLSAGKKYTREDFERMAVDPDEVLVDAKKIELLDLASREGKEIKVTLITGNEVTGKLQYEGATLAGDYICGEELIHASDVQSVEIL